MVKSACGVSVSVSVELLLSKLGSVTPLGGGTVAVLLRLPVAAGSMVALSRNEVLAPEARVPRTILSFLGWQPPTPTLFPYTPLFRSGSVSLTVAPVTELGPLLVTVIV